MSLRIIGSEPSRYKQFAIVYETLCPKCGEVILIKNDVKSNILELSVGSHKTVDSSKTSLPTDQPFRGRQVA